MLFVPRQTSYHWKLLTRANSVFIICLGAFKPSCSGRGRGVALVLCSQIFRVSIFIFFAWTSLCVDFAFCELKLIDVLPISKCIIHETAVYYIKTGQFWTTFLHILPIVINTWTWFRRLLRLSIKLYIYSTHMHYFFQRYLLSDTFTTMHREIVVR
jgi:hypothetical protein